MCNLKLYNYFKSHSYHSLNNYLQVFIICLNFHATLRLLLKYTLMLFLSICITKIGCCIMHSLIWDWPACHYILPGSKRRQHQYHSFFLNIFHQSCTSELWWLWNICKKCMNCNFFLHFNCMQNVLTYAQKYILTSY